MANKPTYEELERKVQELEKVTTEHKRMEVSAESEDHWRSLLENIPSFISVADRDGTVQYVNRTVPGMTIEEAIGKKVNDFELPEYHEISTNVIKNVFLSGISGNYQVRGIGPDRTTSWYEIHFGPIKQDGQVVAVAFITTDITGRKRVEDELREASKIKEKVISESPVGMTIYDAVSGKCLAGNKAMAKLVGATEEQVLAQNFYTIESWKDSGLLETAKLTLKEDSKKKWM